MSQCDKFFLREELDMRTRGGIMGEATSRGSEDKEIKSVNDNLKLVLEVLLDIRDLLEKVEGNTY